MQPSEVSKAISSFLNIEVLSSSLTHFDASALVVKCCIEKEGILDIKARYDDQKLPAELMKRILQQLKHVFKQLSASHRVMLSQLELLSSQEL